MRIGLFGGSFDPVHFGHLTIARAAMSERKYAKLFWIPAACSPFKTPSQSEVPGEHRAAMVRLAIAQDSDMAVSDYELKKKGVSYSVETMRYFQGQYPGAQLEWLLGADAVMTLETWHEPEALAKGMVFVAAARPGFSFSTPAGFQIYRLAAEEISVSSTELKKQLADGKPTRNIPESVVEYIREHGLYQKGKT